jgi:hypothetical protein
VAITSTTLQPGLTLTGTLAAIVTAAGTGRTIITKAVFSNPTAAAVTLSVSTVRAGGAALVLIPPRSVAPNTTEGAIELTPFALGPGDVVSASGAGLVAFLDGYVIS